MNKRIKSKKQKMNIIKKKKYFFAFIKENIISIISLCISCITLVIAIKANYISKSNINMQYELNLPSLNMNMSYNDELMSCKIINNGGNMREAILIPHMFLEMRYCPEFEIKKTYAIEISDFFSEKFIDGLYWTPVETYNIEENGWILDIDQDKMNQALSLLFQIQDNIEISDITSQLSLCLEIKYIDFIGNSHVEWYYADYFNGGILIHIDEGFYLPLEQYLNAKSINIDEICGNQDVIDKTTRDFEENLSIE